VRKALKVGIDVSDVGGYEARISLASLTVINEKRLA